MSEHEVILVINRVKTEHVGTTLRRMNVIAKSLTQEGLDVDVSFSVERDCDGVERWHEWIDEEGQIKDIQPWEVTP